MVHNGVYCQDGESDGGEQGLHGEVEQAVREDVENEDHRLSAAVLHKQHVQNQP